MPIGHKSWRHAVTNRNLNAPTASDKKTTARPIAAATPINGRLMPTRRPSAPADVEDTQRGQPRFRHAGLCHIDEDLLEPDEVQCGRKRVDDGSQNGNDDAGRKH